MAILLVYSSKSGNTETFIDFLKKHSDQEIEVHNDLNVSIDNYEKIAIGSYTWSDGKIPTKMKKFLIDNQDNLQGKEIFIFGSGNSVYPKFCRAVDSIERIVTDCFASVKGTFKFEQRFNEDELLPDEKDNLIRTIKNWSAV